MRDGRLILVHSVPIGASFDEGEGTVADLRSCDTSEELLDAMLNDVSIMSLGTSLPDPARLLDLLVLERLARAARWKIPLSIDRLCSTLFDPSTFVFAGQVLKRGRDELTRSDIKNCVKRLRGAIRVAGLRDVLLYRHGGYLLNTEKILVGVRHINL